MDVATGRDVEVVLGNLLATDNAAEPFFFAPRPEGFGDMGDAFLRDVVLRVAFDELAAAGVVTPAPRGAEWAKWCARSRPKGIVFRLTA